MLRRILAGIIPFVFAAGAAAETVVVKNFTLIDGIGGAPATGAAMVMADERIQSIEPAASIKTPSSSSAA